VLDSPCPEAVALENGNVVGIPGPFTEEKPSPQSVARVHASPKVAANATRHPATITRPKIAKADVADFMGGASE
jgi:hypothetical protein